MLVVNVYFPTSGTDLYVDIVTDMSGITNVSNDQLCKYITISGDFNNLLGVNCKLRMTQKRQFAVLRVKLTFSR